ncbi:MAG: isoprenylcysteine carboxylmethyltransferase family protein [Deltaproteobacteria bacterium]|nr:isoprenylcysteine carboxylmethyltransferase family protein [Candidatus Zymogenaceae bacterium]
MRIQDGIRTILKGFKNLLGSGLYLLSAGLALEVLTVALRRHVSFPVSLTREIQIALTIPCVVFCVAGMMWFRSTLHLIKVNLMGGENRLVTCGPFNYVRHPLYATLMIALPPLLVIWCADLLFIAPWAALFIIARYIVLLEENRLVRLFGEEYERYRRHVPAFVPYKGAGGKRYREEGGGGDFGGNGEGVD